MDERVLIFYASPEYGTVPQQETVLELSIQSTIC